MINWLKLTNISTYDWRTIIGPCFVNLQNVTKIVTDYRRYTAKCTMIHFSNCEPVLVKESVEEIERLIQK